MCRLLGYLGPPIPLDQLLYKPPHSLVVQSYQPKELEVALLNADGFGVGWYGGSPTQPPFVYRNTAPIWNDINLPDLSRYVQSGCILANIRSATPGLAVDLSNCQPFRHDRLLFTHNGFIEKFRQTLYRPLRERLGDTAYQAIHGLTDSEHIFATLVHELAVQPQASLVTALQTTLTHLQELAECHAVRVAANLIVTDGQQLVISRYDNQERPPSLYWWRDDVTWPGAIVVASEPLMAGDWQGFPENSLCCVGADLELHTYPALG